MDLDLFASFCVDEDFELKVRPEDLSLEQYLKLFNLIKNSLN